MRVTVCQWPKAQLEMAWERLIAHVRHQASELVLLPEMPFSPWFAASSVFNEELWNAAIAAHDAWQSRFAQLGDVTVIGTRPVDFGNKRYNAGFVWDPEDGNRAAHVKAYIANEEGAWEGAWYEAAEAEFTPVQLSNARVGFLIGTELWAMEEARVYGAEGVHMIVTPRLTGASTREKWLAAGRVAAVLAGAYSLSSNWADESGNYGAQGWIIGPDADAIAVTSADEPFVTSEVDLTRAEYAKHTYPRDVFLPQREPGATPRELRH
jgi:N-carbamoylputrescine amidase